MIQTLGCRHDEKMLGDRFNFNQIMSLYLSFIVLISIEIVNKAVKFGSQSQLTAAI